MMQPILYIQHSGSESRIELKEGQACFVVGRHKSCDYVIDSKNISRKHVKVTFQHECVYVENVSSSGLMKLSDQAVEYVAFPESAELSFGDAILYWRFEEVEVKGSPATHENQPPAAFLDFSHDAAEPDNAGDAFMGEAAAPGHLAAISPSDTNDDAAAFNVATDGPESLLLEGDSKDQHIESSEESIDKQSTSIVISDTERTRLNEEKAKPTLKVIRGERVGREIKLEFGSEWVVGRAKQCHIQIDNQKLSRQHFKITKIGDRFRVQDLDSSHGTRVNGIAVADSPLKAFDTIQAANLEIQFVLMSPHLNSELPLGANSIGYGPAQGSGFGDLALPLQAAAVSDSGEKTVFAPLVPVGESQRRYEEMNFDFDAAARASVGGGGKGSSSAKRSGISAINEQLLFAKVWFIEQPRSRQVVLSLLVLVLLFSVLMMSVPSSDTEFEPTPVIQAMDTGQTSQGLSPLGADVSPEFSLLSEQEKNLIMNLYAEAERARREKDWQKAFNASSEILSRVRRYRSAGDIMLEAQTYINDNLIGAVSGTLSNVHDSARDNAEQIALLVTEGMRALESERWDDAQASFAKALNLDPNHPEATRGFGAAHAKDKNFAMELPDELPVIDEKFEIRQAERSVLDAYNKQFQDARVLIYQGQSPEALPILADLRKKLSLHQRDYNSGRVPASVRSEFQGGLNELVGRTDEALETAKANLRAEYQIQLADANSHISNRQFPLAREIYDRILAQVPDFEEVRQARRDLYGRILNEARNVYQESLIYESVGDLRNSLQGYEATVRLLENVDDFHAEDYYRKAQSRVRRLKR